jgi:beta-barrel assembly-enhancing protease
MTLSLFRPRVRKLTAAMLLSTWLAPLPLPVLAQVAASAPAASVNPGLGSAAAADQVQSNLNRSVQIGRQSPYLPKEPIRRRRRCRPRWSAAWATA